MDIEHVRSRFIKHFDGTTGFVYASPGRINLIGEHTDYIERRRCSTRQLGKIYIRCVPRNDQTWR